MRIGIVGGGVVGHATARTYVEFHDVMVHDVREQLSTHQLHDVLDCDIIFLCLPTPQIQGGKSHNLAAIHTFLSSDIPREASYVLRSTVPVGTTKRLRSQYGLENLIFSPEFLTARCSVVDSMIPARNIIGGKVCRAALDLTQLYEGRFPGTPLYVMGSDEAEAVKLFLNGFFATKVAYWNECRDLADVLNLNWESVMKGVLSDGRLTPNHTQVPGPDGKRGYGGTCLPKDISSLWQQMQENGVQSKTIWGAMSRSRRGDSGA